MTDPLTILGGLATLSQILVYLAQTTKAIVDFRNDVAEAPVILFQIQEKLSILHQVLSQLHSGLLPNMDNHHILAPETMATLRISAGRVQDALGKARAVCQRVADGDIKKARRRIIWVLKDRPALKKLLDDLEDCDRVLQLLIQFATL